VECTLEWTDGTVRVHASKRGPFQLPYTTLRVLPPPGEQRPLAVSGEAITLVNGLR
jgi:hypothetical protein